MSKHPPAEHGWRPTRRGAVAGALALALTACSDSPPPPSGRAPDVAPNDPDAPTLAAARAETVALLREYDAAVADRPELAGELAPLRAAHEAHLEKLGRPAAEATPSPTPGPGRSRAALLRGLAAAEKSAAARRVSQCQDLRSASLARLVAGIGGAEAAHASLLRDLAGGE
ncbi:MAG: hypothetical protein ACT4QF_15335 [Sporichthyaceae bacterium]